MATFAMTTGSFLQGSLSVIAPFLVEDLGLTRTELGVLFFALLLSGAAVAPLAGRWTDASLSISLWALFGSAAAGLVVMGSAANLWWAFGAVIVASWAFAAANPVTNKIVLTRVPPRRLGLALGTKQSGPFIAIVVAGAALPGLSGLIGWRGAVFVAAALPAAGVAFVSAYGRDDAEQDRLRRGGAAGAPAGAPSVLWLAVAGWMVGLGIMGMLAFVPLYAREALGMSATLSGLAASLMGIVAVVGRIGWGAGDALFRNPRTLLVALPLAGCLSSLAILGGEWHPLLFWVGIVVAGGSVLSWHTAAWLALFRAVERDQVGRASGVVQRGNMLGSALGPPIVGYLVDTTGSYRWVWLLIGAIFVAVSVLLLVWRRSVPDPGDAPGA